MAITIWCKLPVFGYRITQPIIKWVKTVHIPANTLVCAHKENYLSLNAIIPRISLLIIIRKTISKITSLINLPKKNLPTENCYIDELDCYSI